MKTYIKELMKKAFTGSAQKTTGTGAINTTNISKNLKEFQKHKEDIIKTTDKYTKGLREEGKINVRKSVGPALGKVSKITQKLPEKKAKGGRVGLKSGNGFPDLSGDGKTTFKDILIGRGVIKKGKKKTMVAKKFKTPMDQAVKKDKKNKRFV
jgi:hypothetical protein